VEAATLAKIRSAALDTLIDRELLYQESLRAGIRISSSEVDVEVAKLKQRYPREEEYTQSLSNLGLTEEVIKSQIQRGIAIQMLIDSRFGASTTIKESEARSYFDSHQDTYRQPLQIRLSHILIKSGALVNKSGKSLSRIKAENLHQRILQGEDFAQLAGESDDSSSSSIGGDLGWFAQGQLEKNLEIAAFSLEVGQVSPIVADRYGYHILKVTGRREETVLSFEKVREKIISQLQREHARSEIATYLGELRKVASIETSMPEIGNLHD
jgi:peptidyl-prolyl cis-trans isomerase C